jgi:hypothetical protein
MSKFIEVTRLIYGDQIVLNISQIKFIEEFRNGSLIHYLNNDYPPIEVSEDYKFIRQLILEIQ